MFKKNTVQNPGKRSRNFKEVFGGLSRSAAMDQARLFPQTSDPAHNPQCPLGVDIPAFIRILREGGTAGAFQKIQEQNFFPRVCGRICLAPCELEYAAYQSRTPIAIRELERYSADHGRKRKFFQKKAASQGPKIAVVGSGPAGLTAAAMLARHDFSVTVFEALPQLGGGLRYSVPGFRLPKEILKNEIDEVIALGVEFEAHCFVGKTITIPELIDRGFLSVILATGHDSFSSQEISGMMLGGVHDTQELLLQANCFKNQPLKANFTFPIAPRVVVIGSDSAAIDCARVCVRLGKDVTLVFDQMAENQGVRRDDWEYAKQEGVKGDGLMQAVEILPSQEHTAAGVRCKLLDFADPAGDGQWQLIPVPQSEFVVEAETVFMTLNMGNFLTAGQIDSRLEVRENGLIWLNDKTYMSSVKNVFAAGSLAEYCRDVVDAMASGKQTALRVMEYLR